MIDAYTIGITLALEDGVSDGIAAIRRDLAALDTAIAASAAQLLMLRRLAAELPLPRQGNEAVRSASLFARPVPNQQAAQPPATNADAAAIISPAAQASSPTSSPPVVATPPATEALSVPYRATAPAVPLSPPAIERPVVPVLPVQAPPAAVAPPTVQPAPPVPQATPTSVVQPKPAAPAGVPAASGQHASTVPIPVLMPAAPIPPPNVFQPTPQPEARTDRGTALDFAAIARALAPPVSAPTNPTPQQPERLTTIPAPPTGPAPIIMAAAPSEPVPRGIPQRQDMPPPPTSAPVQLPVRSDAPVPTSASRKSAAPVVSVQVPQAISSVATSEPDQPAPVRESAGGQQTDRPTYAELQLDGVALGRWVTRHLERQVTRPQAGATGFDPRITPSWSGAPIGN